MTATATPTRFSFIDWMKTIGMALIVFGHIDGGLIDQRTPPFYPKQLGVAFFMFLTGFSMARDHRPSRVIIPRRLFEIYAIGIAFAALMSVIGLARIGDPAESNYLPFLLGANVAFNFFPANPTTWFIGTYTHAILIGALVIRYARFHPWMLVPTMLIEILIRTVFMQHGVNFIAYMLLTNWATVFLLGFCIGQHLEPVIPGRRSLSLILLATLTLSLAWPVVWKACDLQPTFPFMRPGRGAGFTGLMLVSAGVSFLYTGWSWLLYHLAYRLPDLPLTRFFARNTLFIFIAHMPLYYALLEPLRTIGLDKIGRATLLFVACFIGPAIVSEGLRRLIRLDRLRDRLWPTVIMTS